MWIGGREGGGVRYAQTVRPCLESEKHTYGRWKNACNSICYWVQHYAWIREIDILPQWIQRKLSLIGTCNELKLEKIPVQTNLAHYLLWSVQACANNLVMKAGKLDNMCPFQMLNMPMLMLLRRQILADKQAGVVVKRSNGQGLIASSRGQLMPWRYAFKIYLQVHHCWN